MGEERFNRLFLELAMKEKVTYKQVWQFALSINNKKDNIYPLAKFIKELLSQFPTAADVLHKKFER